MNSWFRGEHAWEASFLHTYPITMFLGIAFSFLTITYFWKRQKYSWDILQILLIIVVPAAILGARAWFLIASGSGWVGGWKDFFFFQGLSIHGGVLGAVVAGSTFLWFRRHAIDMRTVASFVIPAVLIGQVIGRWGNFANHEVYGAVVKDSSSLDWLTFIKPHMLIRPDEFSSLGAQYRQPLFFYESMMNMAGYLGLVWLLLRKNWLKPGAVAALYFVWYGIVRVAMEPIRDPADIMSWGNFQVSTAMSVMWIIIGLGLFVWFQFFTNPSGIIKKRFPNIQDKYEKIMPIKTRKVWFVGEKSNKRKKHVLWGEEIDHRIIIWLPKEHEAWTKREIQAGKRNK